MHVLTLDLGTGSLKACLWDELRLLQRESAPIFTRHDGPRAEQNPDDWWTATRELLRHIDTSNVGALCVTGHMHCVVPTDENGRALSFAAVVPDRRATHACQEIAESFGVEAVLRKTGGRLDPTSVAAKARHFRDDLTWREARWLLAPKDWLRMQFTDEAFTDPIDGVGSLFWSIARDAWWRELAEFCGAREHALPPVRPTASVCGEVSQRAARETGLRAGTPVVCGGGDDIESFGAGAVSRGDFYEHLGTTGSLFVSLHAPRVDASARVECVPDVTPERWLLGGSTSAAGASLRWIGNATGNGMGPRDDWAQLVGDAPGEAVFLPYLGGERCPLWKPERAGAFVGLRAHHGPNELRRAVLEGVLFSLRHVFEALREVAPEAVGPVCVSGPLADSRALAQLRADVYGAEVTRRALPSAPEAEATSVAALFLALSALRNRDPFEVAREQLQTLWTVAPRPHAHAAFSRGYEKFLRASQLLEAWDAPSQTEAQP